MTSDRPPPASEHAAFAQVGSRYYPVLVAVFTALVIISNVTATKGVAFGPIITDGGFIVFPLTYVIGDVLSEVYGFKAARRAIFLGFSMNILAALAFWVTIYLPAADFYTNEEHFENVVHAYTQLIIAGLAGFIVGPDHQRVGGRRDQGTHQGEAPVGAAGRLDVRRPARRHAGVLQHRRAARSASPPSATSPSTPRWAGSTRPRSRW